MQLLFEFFPLIAFFVAFIAFDLYVATATIIVAIGLQIAYQWFRHRKVNKMLLISGALVAVFGGITLALRNPLFIQWKVTVVNWLFAAGVPRQPALRREDLHRARDGARRRARQGVRGASSTRCGS